MNETRHLAFALAAAAIARCAVRTACSSEASYDPNGRSQTRNGVFRPRRVADASMTSSSTEIGTVLG